MAHLLLEDGRLINTDLVSNVTFREHEQTARCWGYEVPMSSDSRIVYRHYKAILDQCQKENEAAAAKEKAERDTAYASVQVRQGG